MTPEAILALVNGLISLAFQAYSSLKEVTGEDKIPTWDEIINENALLQAKIDAEN
jgi:hypothetical protein